MLLFSFFLLLLTNSPNAIIGGSTGRNRSLFEKRQDIVMTFKGHNTHELSAPQQRIISLWRYNATQIRKSKKPHFYSRWTFNVTVMRVVDISSVDCFMLINLRSFLIMISIQHVAAIGYSVCRVSAPRRQQKPGQSTKSNFNYSWIVAFLCLKRTMK